MSDTETQPSTQFDRTLGDDEELYSAVCILDERMKSSSSGGTTGEFLVKWRGIDPDTGKGWKPTWVTKTGCTDPLIQEWKQKKRQDPTIVGKYQEDAGEESEGERPKARKQSSRRKSESSISRKGKTSVRANVGQKRKRAGSRATDELEDVDTVKSVPERGSILAGDQPAAGPSRRTRSSAAATTTTPKSKRLRKSSTIARDIEVEDIDLPTVPSSPISRTKSSRTVNSRSISKSKSRSREPEAEKEDVIVLSDTDDARHISGDQKHQPNMQEEISVDDTHTETTPRATKIRTRETAKARQREDGGSIERHSTPVVAAALAAAIFPANERILEQPSDTPNHRSRESPPTTPPVPEKNTPPAPEKKHVRFTTTTEDSDDDVVPGTMSTNVPSQESQNSGSEKEEVRTEVYVELEARFPQELAVQDQSEMLEDAGVTRESTASSPLTDIAPSQAIAFQEGLDLLVAIGMELDPGSEGSAPLIPIEDVRTGEGSVDAIDEEDMTLEDELEDPPPVDIYPAEPAFSTPTRSSMRPIQQLTAKEFNDSLAHVPTSQVVDQTQDTIEDFSSPLRDPTTPKLAKSRGKPPISEQQLADNTGSEDPFRARSQVTAVQQPEAGCEALGGRMDMLVEEVPSASKPPEHEDDQDTNPIQAITLFACGWPECESCLDSIKTLQEHVKTHMNSLTNPGDVDDRTDVQAESSTAGTAMDSKLIELDELLRSRESRISDLEGNLDRLASSLKTTSDDLQFHRELYQETSNKAYELAESNNSLQEEVDLLKSQLQFGLQQQKLHAEAGIQGLRGKITDLSSKLGFLLEQNRATGDELRKRASHYPVLQRECAGLRFELMDETRRATQAENTLKKVNKENRRLRDQLDILDEASDEEESDYEQTPEVETYPQAQELANMGFPIESSEPLAGSSAEAETTPLLLEGDVDMEVDTSHIDDPATETPQASFNAILPTNTATIPQISLLASLKQSFETAALPFSVEIDVTQSQAKRTSNLFPYTETSQKVWETHFLVTITGNAQDTAGSQSEPVILCALEAYQYTIPTTLSTLLYISKVDSSGQSALSVEYKSPPVTSFMMTSVLKYYMSPATRPTPRVYCQLFARAQNQYLFPNSVQSGTKKTLSGLGLCKWWRSVFERAALEVHGASVGEEYKFQLKCWLPGLEPAESERTMGASNQQLPEGVVWSYDVPYTGVESTPLSPTPVNPSVVKIGYIVPYLEDDPKARYINELISLRITQAQSSLKRERQAQSINKAGSESTGIKAAKEKRKAEQAKERKEYAKALEPVKIDEFWTTLAARQECQPGDITGFIGMAVIPLEPIPDAAIQTAKLEEKLQSSSGLSGGIVSRIVACLLNHDFASRTLALTASTRFLAEIANIIKQEIGEERWNQSCKAYVEKKSEPVLLEKRTEETARSSSSVNVLVPVRRKKKPTVSQSTSQAPSQELPKRAYICMWRLQDEAGSPCSALFEQREDLEGHGVEHVLAQSTKE